MFDFSLLKLAVAVATGLIVAGWSGRLTAAEHLAGSERQKERAYSPAVVTEGGQIVWLAGQTTTTNLQGADISGDFDAQARTVFQLLDKTLQRAGGRLADMVTMTVFITDPRYGDRFVQIRREFFAHDAFPASALITVSDLARPGILIEIQGIAVINERK